MTKYFIACGNSITAGDEFPDKNPDNIFDTSEFAWPALLGKKLGYHTLNKGVSGNSNAGMIRITISEVERLLASGVKSDDITVGIMWTDFARWEQRTMPPGPSMFYSMGGWIIDIADNFDKFEKSGDWGSYVGLGKRRLQTCVDFRFYNLQESDLIDEFLAILHRTQLYLESKSIKYFMCFSGTSFLGDNHHSTFKQSPIHKPAIDLIDWSKFVTISDEIPSDIRSTYYDIGQREEFLSLEEVAAIHNTGYHQYHHPRELAHELYVDYLAPVLIKDNMI